MRRSSGVPFPLIGVLFGELVDDLNGASCDVEANQSVDSYQRHINRKVLLVVCAACAAFGLIFIYVNCWTLFSHRLAHRLRERYFQKLLQKDISFFDKQHAGTVSARLHADIQAVQSGTCEKLGVVAAIMSFFITAFTIALIKQPALAGMLSSVIPAFLLSGIVCGAFIHKFSLRLSSAMDSASSIASEALHNIGLVQVFGASLRLEAKFMGHLRDARISGLKKAFAASVQAGLLYFIAYAANALAFWQGSRLVADSLRSSRGGASVGDVYTVVFVITEGIFLGTIAPLLTLFSGAASAFLRLKADMEGQATCHDGPKGCDGPFLGTPPAIDFQGVSFHYSSRAGQPVLRNLTIHVPAGKHTAIVGASGSGKSTVASLITRLHDPIDGNLSFNDRKINDLNLEDIRGMIGLVDQDPSLLNRSLFENIALGLLGSTMPAHQKFKPLLLSGQLADYNEWILGDKTPDPLVEELFDLVRDAASLANAADFISDLELGYATMAGSNGTRLSGGQKQRIALARAIIREPPVLILDEATSSLDSTTERLVLDAVKKTQGSRTTISIAHRLSTIRDADNIIVLKDGAVVESGAFPELMALGEVFANMARLQQLESPNQRNTSDDSDLTREPRSPGLQNKHSKSGAQSSAAMVRTEDSVAGPVLDNCDKRGVFSIMNSSTWLIRPSILWLVFAFMAAVIVGCTFSASGLIFGHVVAALDPCNSTVEKILHYGKLFGGLMFMFAVVEFLANCVSWSFFGRFAEDLLFRMRVLSFRALMEQTYQWHNKEGHNPSALLSLITKDSAAVGGFSGSVMGTIFSILVNVLAAIILSHILAWKIAIVCLATVPILLIAGVAQIRSLAAFEKKSAVAFNRAVNLAMEAVNNIRTISVFKLEEAIANDYRRELRGPRKYIFLGNVFSNLCLSISTTVGLFIYALVYWWGSQLIIRGEYTQTDFFTILIAMVISAQLWGQTFTLAPEVSRAKTAAARIRTMIEAGSTQRLTPHFGKSDSSDAGFPRDVEISAEKTTVAEEYRIARGTGLQFKHVSYYYPSSIERPALRDVSFEIRPGQFCGIVGASGAGKSTIFNLIQATHIASSGSIHIDGRDIADIDIAAYRAGISILPQGNMLFSGTIAFNVGLGAHPGRDATDQEIEEACRLAGIHDTIMAMDQRYQTDCGPNGSRLSGGQRQRIAIARALVRKPQLLLLDESTSALDAESELVLQQGLEEAFKGVTFVAISHRLHTLRRADMILVVQDGRVVDIGRHEDLMARSETYRRNAQQQMLE